MSHRRPNDKILSKWNKERADYEKLVDDLKVEIDRLKEIIENNFHPKGFNTANCTARGICPFGDCEKLNVNCKMGKERNCTLCENFNSRDKCDNWAWYNCTLARMQARYGKDVYEREFKRITSAVETLKKTEKAGVENGSLC